MLIGVISAERNTTFCGAKGDHEKLHRLLVVLHGSIDAKPLFHKAPYLFRLDSFAGAIINQSIATGFQADTRIGLKKAEQFRLKELSNRRLVGASQQVSF